MSIIRDNAVRKTERHEFRLTSAQKELISRAAEISGKNVSDFILENAVLAAEMAILDQRVFNVSENEFANWEALLESAPRANAGLARLFAEPLTWPES